VNPAAANKQKNNVASIKRGTGGGAQHVL